MPNTCHALHLLYLTKSSQYNFSNCFKLSYVIAASQVTPQNLHLILHKAPRMPRSVLTPCFFISRYAPTSPSKKHSLPSAKPPVSLPPPLRDASPSCSFCRQAPLRTHFPCSPPRRGAGFPLTVLIPLGPEKAGREHISLLLFLMTSRPFSFSPP